MRLRTHQTVTFVAPTPRLADPVKPDAMVLGRRSRKPRVNPLCAPPPCGARLISLAGPYEVDVSSGLAVGSLTTLASTVSLLTEAPTGSTGPRLVDQKMYGAVMAGGNAERVLCGCTPVIALAAAPESLLAPAHFDQRYSSRISTVDSSPRRLKFFWSQVSARARPTFIR